MSKKHLLWLLSFVFVAALAFVAVITDPGDDYVVLDRVFACVFGVFAAGLAGLFTIFIVMVILGKIDLPKAFHDKTSQDKDKASSQGNSNGSGKVSSGLVSLSRLQAFLWTLVVLVIYFHKAVTAAVYDNNPGLPALPAEILMVMGISGALYLVGKQAEGKEGKDSSPSAQTGKPQAGKSLNADDKDGEVVK